MTAKVLQRWIAAAQKRASLRATGALHVLRHIFCSHLAMRGAPALSFQRLVHLAEGEADRAIRLLNTPLGGGSGDMLETAGTPAGKAGSSA